MAHLLILTIIVGGVLLYFMTPAERVQSFRATLRGLRRLREVVVLEGFKCDDFADALRARTGQVIAAPFLIAVSTTVSIFAFFAPSAFQDGWRHAVTAIVAHPSLVALLINVACLLQVGLILERLVGPVVFVTVYGSAGVAAGIVSLFTPSAAAMGASASMLGLYGLLLVISTWGALRSSVLTIPLVVVKRLSVAAGVFLLSQLITGGIMHLAFFAALATGVVAGVAIARDVDEGLPPVRRLATCMAAIVAIAGTYAVVMAHQAQKTAVNVGPEIERVIDIEHHTSSEYDKAAEQFRKGRIPATSLIQMIEHTIRPELRVVAQQLRALRDVGPEDQLLVAAAGEFLNARDESWAMRADALRKSDMKGLQKADAQEQRSLSALQRIKTMN